MTLQPLNGGSPVPQPIIITGPQAKPDNQALQDIGKSVDAGIKLGSDIGFALGVMKGIFDAFSVPQDQAPPGSDFPETVPDLGPVPGSDVLQAGSREAQVTQIYREVLGREPDPQGLKDWVNGGLNLDQVRQGIASSPEGQRVARVREAVQSITGREATGEEIKWFHSQLDTPGTTFDGVVANFKDLLADNARKLQELQARQAELQPITDFNRIWKEEVGVDYSGDGQFMQSLADELKRGVPEDQIRERVRKAAIERYATSGEALPAGARITPEEVISQIFRDVTGGDINIQGVGPGPLAQRYREGMSFEEIRKSMEETQRYRKEKYGS